MLKGGGMMKIPSGDGNNLGDVKWYIPIPMAAIWGFFKKLFSRKKEV